MISFKTLFLLFLIVPLTELYLLISVGEIVGVLPTIGLVIFTAILGANMLQRQGTSTLRRFQGTLQQGQLPAIELVEGLMLLVCGALLLTPGFVTDTIGFLLLVPAIRRFFAALVIARFKPQINVGGFHRGQAQTEPRRPASGGHVYEGEYKRD